MSVALNRGRVCTQKGSRLVCGQPRGGRRRASCCSPKRMDGQTEGQTDKKQVSRDLNRDT